MRDFVDANIVIRFLTGDDPESAERCLALLQRAQRGEIELVTSEAIVAEVVYVSSAAEAALPRSGGDPRSTAEPGRSRVQPTRRNASG